MQLQKVLGRHCGSLAHLNLLLVSLVGIFQVQQAVIGSVSYTKMINNLTVPAPESEEQGEEQDDVQPNLCHHLDENKQVLLHFMYLFTSLVIVFAITEVANATLLVRIAYESRMNIKTSWRKLWTGINIIIILLILVTFGVLMPLKEYEDAADMISKLSPLVLFLIWKIFIIIIFNLWKTAGIRHDGIRMTNVTPTPNEHSAEIGAENGMENNASEIDDDNESENMPHL